MRTYLTGLQNQVVSSYDKTKTTIAGRAFQKTLMGQQVIGPPLTEFLDVETITGIAPSFTYFNPTTNRLFVLSTASPSPTVMLFNFNATTGVSSYVGQITMRLANLAATTHTFRGFAVDDSNSSSIKVFISTTGSVLINGGTYMGYGIALADFTPGGTVIWSAISTGAKATYFLQDSGAMGVSNVATTSWGCALPFKSSNSAINTKVYQLNGTVAAPVMYAWDYSVSPQVANTISAAVSAQTTLFAGTSPSAFFSSGTTSLAAYAANDPVVITGTTPTGFTATTAGAAQTVYFIRDIQNISGSWYFNLAATSGGAAITPTGAASGFSLMRASGISSNGFSYKTGSLSPALSGVILQVNSFGYCMPTSAPLNSALNGQDCFYIATSTTLYLVKASDLSSAGTSWPSLTGANALGTGSDIVAPTISEAVYSTELDRFVYITNTSSFVVKPLQNNTITAIFGGLVASYLENTNPPTTQVGLAAVAGLTVLGGWMFISGSTIGQRGIVACDIQSDTGFGFSYVISPVVQTQTNAIFRAINTFEALFDYTDSLTFQYRTASTSTDPTFSSATTGWTTIATAADLSTITLQQYVQFRLLFDIATFDANTPAQVSDILFSLQYPGEMSDNWAVDEDSSTVGTNTPSYVGFLLTRVYQTLPTTLYVRGYDLSGNLVSSVNDNTTSNPSLFTYSTDGGVTWNAFSMAALTTVGVKLRYNVASPPGTTVVISLRET